MTLLRKFRAISAVPRDLFSLPVPIWRISFVMFLYYFGWGIVEPFLPIYFNDLLGSYTSVGIIFSLLYFFSMILSFPFGDLMDKVSKKTILTFMLFFYLPIGPILAMLRTLAHAVLFRMYHAFLATGLWSSTESYVRSHSPRGQASESMGLFDMAIASANIGGAILGGILISRFGIQVLFYMMPFFSAAALLAVMRLPDHDGAFTFIASIKNIFKRGLFLNELRDFFAVPGIARVTVLAFIFNVVGAGVIVVLPLTYNAFGATFWEIGLIYALFMVPAFFEAPFSVLADRTNKRLLFVLGSLAAIILLSFMVYAHSVFALFVLSLMLGVSFSLLRPLIEGIVTNCMPPERIGEINGVYRSFVLFALAVGSFIVGPVADMFSIQAPFAIGAAAMACFLVASLFIPRGLLERAG